MKNLVILSAAVSLLLGGCSQREKAQQGEPSPVMITAAPLIVSKDAEESPGVEETVKFTPPVLAAAAAPATAARRLLIYHADLRVKVASMPRATGRLDSLVQRSGGYRSAATETREDGEWRQETTLRVPPARFDAVLRGVAGLGTVEQKKLSTDDVTAEHADVAARLRTKRAVEQRYVALLGQAKRIKDVLDIEEKIGEVREEIESTESRLKTLDDEVAYSTITLTCYQPIAQAVPDPPVVSLGSRLVESFYGGWSLLMSLLVGTVAIWPLLVLGGGAWWGLRRWRRARALRTNG